MGLDFWLRLLCTLVGCPTATGLQAECPTAAHAREFIWAYQNQGLPELDVPELCFALVDVQDALTYLDTGSGCSSKETIDQLRFTLHVMEQDIISRLP